MTKKPVKENKSARSPRVVFKFTDNPEVRIRYAEWVVAYLEENARMFASDDPILIATAKARHKEIAQRLSESTSLNLMRLTNVQKANAQRRDDADKSALDKFEAWRNKNQSSLSALSQVQQLLKYLKSHRISRRTTARLRAMLKELRIK